MFKKCKAKIFTNGLNIIQFPNYNIFSNVNVAYSNVLTNISDTKDNVLPIKEITGKDYTQDLFISEIAEAIEVTEKLFKVFKSSDNTQ